MAVTYLALPGCGGEKLRLGDVSSSPEPDSGAEASTSCPRSNILASEQLWIGDSWVNIPGTQHTLVRDRARAAGTIGPGDDYPDLAASAATLALVADQYATQEASPTKVRVLFMDGGTWDTLVAGGSTASVMNVVGAFNRFLAQVTSDGSVEHIIYYLPPELPTIAGVAALRPGLEQACAASLVPCHFLDLQPLWSGHPEYTATNGIQASVTGGTVIADSIWAILQENCIAQ